MVVGEGVGEHVEHGGRGEVADAVERVPRDAEGVPVDLERVLHRLEDLGTAGVGDPPADVGAGQAVVGEEAVDVVADVLADEVGHLGAEDDAQPGGADVPAHGALGAGVEPAAGGDDARLGGGEGRGAVGPDHDDRGRAVAEQAAGDEVGGRPVVALHGEAAQLDREEHGDVVGVAEEVVVDAGDPCSAGDAAEPDERDALHVVAQADLGGDPGLDRRDGQPGDRRRHDEIDVPRSETGCRERLGDGVRAELGRDADELVVGCPEVRELPVALQREREVSLAHTRVGVEPLEQGAVGPGRAEHVGEGGGDVGLGVAVVRQDAADGREVAHRASVGAAGAGGA